MKRFLTLAIFATTAAHANPAEFEKADRCINRLVNGKNEYNQVVYHTRYSQDVASQICSQFVDDPNPAIHCLENLVNGKNQYGQTVYSTTFSAETAVPLCVQFPSQVGTTRECMGRLVKKLDRYGRTTYDNLPTLPETEASRVCLRSRTESAWIEALRCIHVASGPNDTEYFKAAVADLCAGHPAMPAVSCLRRLVSQYNVDPYAASWFCGQNPSQQAESCLIGMKVRGFGVLPDNAAVQVCIANPSQPVPDAHRMIACMNAPRTGMHQADGNPLPPPVSQGPVPAPHPAGAGSATN